MLGGFCHQRFEEGEVFALFRVPEDAQGEAAGWIFEPFRGAVFGMRGYLQMFADAGERLMVMRLHVRSRTHDRGETRARRHFDNSSTM